MKLTDIFVILLIAFIAIIIIPGIIHEFRTIEIKENSKSSADCFNQCRITPTYYNLGKIPKDQCFDLCKDIDTINALEKRPLI